MNIFDESQVGQLLVATKGTQWEALIQLAVSTGMRQMELLGLRWDDLDWVNRTIRVVRQLARSNDQTIKYASLKTCSGRRTIDLGFQAIEVLRAHYKRQHLNRRDTGEKWAELIDQLIMPVPVEFQQT